jgi:hypothetical protein
MMICRRNKHGRIPPRNPPARKYSFGVAGDFVDFVEEADERQRQRVRDFKSIQKLFRAARS